jgi:hypothetical protein
MSNIIVSKVMTITNVTIGSDNTLTIQSNTIGFIPDEMVIKILNHTDVHTSLSAMYAPYAIKYNGSIVATTAPTMIYYDLTDYYVTSISTPNVHVKLPNGVNNDVTFTASNLAGISNRGVMSVTVEFIKHK